MHATRREPAARRSVRISVCNLYYVSIRGLTERATARLPRSLANMRTVLSHYQTLLDDYRAPGGSFPETMSSEPHRGFLGDHRSVVRLMTRCALFSDIWPGMRQIPILGPVTGRHRATGCTRGAHGPVHRTVRERQRACRRPLRGSLTQVTLFIPSFLYSSGLSPLDV